MAKVMVSLPDELLAEIDKEAKQRSTSRSAFLAAAAVRELLRRRPEAVAAAVARSEQRFEQSGTFESAVLVRADRDARR
jgi:metal-responsive CopG/Arc/MetJ family transcriptional regulator